MIKFVIALLAVFALMTSPALATDAGQKLFSDACKFKDSTVCQDRTTQNGAGTNPINQDLHVATDILAAITGVVAIIMIIVSGFKFASGGGSPETVTKARNTLLWAVIGLAVIALSWTIINFAVDRLIT